MGQYDIAQICLCGHMVNDHAGSDPVHNQEFCSRCGQKTITACSKCNQSIRGYYEAEGVVDLSGFTAPVPAFCESCGKPYPWTESRLDAARELVDGLGLDIPETTLLNESIDELVKDTPKAQVAAVRFRRLTEKAKPVVKEGFKTLLVEIISQAAKKTLGW